MPLTFPRKFTHGVKMPDADAYAELFIWPEGHFQYMVHTRCTDSSSAASVNATIVLLDGKRQPLGTFGMSRDQAWSVGPQGCGQSSQRHDELYGKIPPEILGETEAVALVLRAQDAAFDPGSLGKIAGIGVELELCPTPD